MKTLGPCDICSFVAQSHTPCNRCVRFATTVASGHATLATKRTLLLTWAGLPPAGSHQLCLAHSLDHLVGAGEQHRWDVEVKRARRLQIEDKFELGRLQDRKLCGLRALKDAAGVDADLTEHVEKDRPVAHQKAGFDHLAGSITGRHPVAYCQRGKLHSAAEEEGITR